MEAAQTVQTRQMRVIPSLSQLDRKRAAEAKERWERNRTPVSMPVSPVPPADGAPMLIPQPPAAPTVIAPAAVPAKLRVAAYCRVSTGSVEQETSIENQRIHYERLISANPGWEMADVYWEAAVSGTKKETRPELQRLLADCEAGKVNLVLTKSISRFARNASDCLEMIRKLKELGVTVRFEKENIDTGSMESELLLTLFSTFAEEESHSISRNTAWTKRKQFQDGTFKYSIAPYGYRLAGGTFEVDPEEAPIVREIYDRVLAGVGTPTIAKELNARGIPTGTKKNDGSPGEWSAYMLGKMIPNVVYIGDVLMQKTFRDEHFHLYNNYGERPQYYSEGHHEGIVEKETFELANAALRQRGREKGNVPMENRQLRNNPHNNRYAFSGRLKCGCCGGPMQRITQKLRDGKQYHWGCKTHIIDKDKCWMKREYEETIQNAFMTMLNKLAFAEDAILDAYLAALRNEHSLKHKEKIRELQKRLEQISSEKNRLSVLIAKGCEPVSFRAKTLELDAEANNLRAELAQLQGDPAQVKAARALREQLAIWKRRATDEFPEQIFARIVDHAVVRTSVEVEFHLKCGMTLTESYGGEIILPRAGNAEKMRKERGNMAHIPYGYRIERGRAVIVPEEAEKIRAFLNAYLDGLSIRNAGAKAQIPLSTSALRKMLGNGLYLGTDYYPAVIDRDTFDAVQRDCAARTHEGQSKPSPVTPVRGRFLMAAPEHPDAGWMSACDTAAYLYSLIKPSDRGHTEMTAEEKSAMTAWREQTQTEM